MTSPETEVRRWLEHFGWLGRFQAVSFHPDYRFADMGQRQPRQPHQSRPYPILHLIREESISRAVAWHPDRNTIPDRNVARLRSRTEAQRANLFPYLCRARA